MHYTFTEFIRMLYTFLVTSFSEYKKYMICLISFSKFSDVLPIFICARAIGNLWSISQGVSVLRLEWSKTLSEKPVPLVFIGNILLSKASRTLSASTKSVSC